MIPGPSLPQVLGRLEQFAAFLHEQEEGGEVEELPPVISLLSSSTLLRLARARDLLLLLTITAFTLVDLAWGHEERALTAR